MQPYETARQKIIDDLSLNLTLQEIRNLELTLSWLFNKGAAKAMAELGKGVKRI